MTIITFVVTDTIDLRSLVEFEELKFIISLNNVDFVFFQCIWPNPGAGDKFSGGHRSIVEVHVQVEVA